MDIDLTALEAAARATDNEPWRQDGEDGREVHSAFGDGADHFVARTVYPSEAAFVAAANPGVVLELVRRLKAAEEKLGAMRPLLIGNVNGDATLFGSQEEVKAFHLKMRENEEFARQVAVEECIAEKVEAFKGLERCSVDEIAEDAGYSDAKYLWLTDVERLLGIPPKQEKPRRPWAEVTGKGRCTSRRDRTIALPQIQLRRRRQQDAAARQAGPDLQGPGGGSGGRPGPGEGGAGPGEAAGRG